MKGYQIITMVIMFIIGLAPEQAHTQIVVEKVFPTPVQTL